MFLYSLFFAFLIAAVLTGIFSTGLRTRGPFGSAWVFFFVVFLAAWAGGLWITPIGPAIWGLYWLPFLVAGLVFALLLAATTPRRESTTVELQRPEETHREASALLTLEAFFWAWVVLLSAVILTRYFWH